MKIVFIVESLNVGGTELSLMKWLRECNRGLFDPIVLSFRSGPLKDELEDLGVETIVLKKKGPFDIVFLFQLVEKLKTLKPDLVHCRNGIPAISYGVLAANMAKIPVVSSVHGRTHYIKTGLKTKLWFWSMNKSQAVITVTEGIKDEISKLGTISRDKIKVVYNGIKLNGEGQLEPTTIAKRNGIRENFGLKDTDFVIGTVGNLREIKGHKYLVQAMQDIVKEVPDAKLVLIGEGDEEWRLKKLVLESGLEEQVKFLGFRSNAKELIMMFDVFALSSLSEGFPNVLLEAMINRVPIVSTRVGGVGEILENDESGLLVDASNAKALASAVLKVYKSENLKNKLIKHSFQRVQENFDINKTFSQYENVYRSLVN